MRHCSNGQFGASLDRASPGWRPGKGCVDVDASRDSICRARDCWYGAPYECRQARNLATCAKRSMDGIEAFLFGAAVVCKLLACNLRNPRAPGWWTRVELPERSVKEAIVSFVFDSRGIERHKCSCSLFGHATTWLPVQNMYKHWPGSEPPGDGINLPWRWPLHLAVSRVRYRHVSSTACKASASGRTIASIRRSAF